MKLVNFLREVLAVVVSGLVGIILILIGLVCFILTAFTGWILLGVVLFVMVYLLIKELMDG